MRLFLAIDPGPALKAIWAGLPGRLESLDWKLRFTPPENLHLTLHFLGETPENILADLHHDLSAVASARRPFDLRAGALGVFPNWEDPRILWAGVEDRAGKLAELFEATRKVLNGYRLFKLEGAFQPHLTLARVTHLSAAWDPRRAKALAPGWSQDSVMPVNDFCLMQSHLTSAGSSYHLVERFHLSKSAS